MEMKIFTSLSSCNVLMVAIVALTMVKNCTAATTTNSSNTNFIQSCCASTRYSKLCYSSLSPYASSVGTNRTKLAIVALQVSLNATRNTSALVTKISRRHDLTNSEDANIKDCVDEVSDAVDRLRQSLNEMDHLGGSDFDFNKNSIQTWASAALTDDQTCLDGMDGLDGKMDKKITKHVMYASRLTSNALAIINSLTSNSNSNKKSNSKATVKP